MILVTQQDHFTQYYNSDGDTKSYLKGTIIAYGSYAKHSASVDDISTDFVQNLST
jgi:hypothetical protein